MTIISIMTTRSSTGLDGILNPKASDVAEWTIRLRGDATTEEVLSFCKTYLAEMALEKAAYKEAVASDPSVKEGGWYELKQQRRGSTIWIYHVERER